MHGSEPRSTLALLGDVSSTFREHSLRLRREPAVSRVTRQCDVLGGAQPSIEWHVDAELTTSDGFSWRLLLYWSGEAWVIEADATRIRAGGSDVEGEFPQRVCDDAGLAGSLRAAAAELVSTMPSDG